MKPTVQESSGTVDQTGTLPCPATGSAVRRTTPSGWDDDGSDGFQYQTLFDDPTTGLRTMLMRVEGGVLTSPHAHNELEQVLVLEGEFYDADRTYGPGDFIVRAPGAIHTGGSKEGALVLLIYSPPPGAPKPG